MRTFSALPLALRMTLWYALSSFALILVAVGLLYLVLVNSVYQEHQRDLADNLNNALLLLPNSSASAVYGFGGRGVAWSPPHQPEISLRVIDANARTIVETPGLSDELPPPSKAALASIHPPDGTWRETVSPSGEPFLSLIVPTAGAKAGDSPRYLEVAMSREHDEHLLAQYRNRLWLVLGISLVLCSVIGHIIARSGMRPIESIGDKAARISASTLDQRIDTAGLPAELLGLAKTFNEMLDRLHESFRHVSQFSDDVAHELRTPVNNLRGEIEVVLSRSRSGDEYRGVLESCLDEANRIARLIRTLLFLARADNSLEALQRERTEVGLELRKVQSYYEAAAAEAGVDLDVAAADGLYAEINRTLFQQALGNLVSNALAHTPKGGAVRLSAGAERDGLSVWVKDTGSGIAPEHLPRIFERFYRVDRARSSAQNAGLGLAVVKSIATRHGGRVTIESGVGQGTEVKLYFPKCAWP